MNGNNLTQDQFLDRARATHGDRYNYSRAVYTYSNTKLTIICREHGEFTQRAQTHYRGQGCPTCGNAMAGQYRKYNQASFCAAVAKHYPGIVITGDYIGADETIAFHCPVHRAGQRICWELATGKGGCQGCEADAKLTRSRLTLKEYRARVAVFFPDVASSVTNYIDMHHTVDFVCPEHGPQKQQARHLAQGNSCCPACATHGFNSGKPGLLYYLRVAAEPCDVYKIGITNYTVERRFTPQDLALITVLHTKRFKLGKWAKAAESQTLRTFTDDRYTGPDLLSSGNSELFTRDVLNLDKEQQ